jgi:Mlc titration factor MtfA (ptsG expression regulator)
MRKAHRFNGWTLAAWLFGVLLAGLYGYAVWRLRLTRPHAIPGFIFFGLGVAALAFWSFTARQRRRKKALEAPFPEAWRNILEDQVGFYRQLDPGGKQRFEDRVRMFLAEIRITGVQTEVDDQTRLLVAASGIIPLFYFPDWDFYRLEEVLVYPGAFNGESFAQQGKDRDVLGMVGEGSLNRLMILSKPALLQGFKQERDGQNTGIHEFVHLLDGSDGEFDGIPGLLAKQYILPWLGILHKEMKRIARGDSRLRDYGATNKMEFFAVASEYFFERPADLKKNYPELYSMLETIFKKSAPLHLPTK